LESVNVQCSYTQGTIHHQNSHYYCTAENTLNIISTETGIDSASGSHQSEKNNDDVEGFVSQSSSQNTQYFPRNLEKVFKNLKVIDINSGRIKEIHQLDLKPFPKLEVIDLYDNDIQIIEAGTFDFNPNLKDVWLTSKILHIDPKVFDHLSKVTYLYLQGNPCIKKDATGSASAVQTLAQEAYSKCKDSIFSSLSLKLNNLESESKTLTFESFKNFKQNLTNLETEVKISKFSYLSSIKRRIEDLKKSKIPEYIHELKALNGKMDTFEEKLKTSITGLSTNISNYASNSQNNMNELKNSYDQLKNSQNETFSYLNNKIESLENTIKALLDVIKEKSKSTTSPAETSTSVTFYDFEEKLGNHEASMRQLQNKVLSKVAGIENDLRTTSYKISRTFEVKINNIQSRLMSTIENIEDTCKADTSN